MIAVSVPSSRARLDLRPSHLFDQNAFGHLQFPFLNNQARNGLPAARDSWPEASTSGLTFLQTQPLPQAQGEDRHGCRSCTPEGARHTRT